MHVKIIRNFPNVLSCMTQFCYLNATGLRGRAGGLSFFRFLVCLFVWGFGFFFLPLNLKKSKSFVEGFLSLCVSTANGLPTQAGTIPKMIVTHASQIAEHLIWDF